MKVVMCRTHGDPEQLAIEDAPDPSPSAGQVLVRVRAASVNYPDVLLVANRYQIQIPTPFVPGSEFAGEVVEVGGGVHKLAPGDRVFGTAMLGAFAEMVCVPAATLRQVPEGVALSDAAAFSVAYGTAFHALRSVARAGAGDVVLVLGAGGGVGSATVELGRVFGAEVIAAASSAAKLEVCAERGARHLVNYAEEDLRERLREVAPRGVNVVIDPVGGPYAGAALRGLALGGRYVVVGFASGEIPKLPANLILLKSAKVLGFEIRTFADVDPDASERGNAELMSLLAEGRVRPHIGATYPLTQAPAALRHVADRRATGKVVIIP
jgi:NADPH2:quinone reductase